MPYALRPLLLSTLVLLLLAVPGAASGEPALAAGGPAVSLPAPAGVRQVCPRVAAGRGVRAAVWGVADEGTPAAGTGRWQRLLLARLAGDGTPLDLRVVAGLGTPRSCGEFDVAVTTSGEIFVAWLEGPPGNGRVRAARYDAGGGEVRRSTLREMRPPVPGVAEPATGQPLPLRVAVEDDGEIHVAWVELQAVSGVAAPYEPVVLIRSIRPDGELAGDGPFVAASAPRFSLAALPEDGLVGSYGQPEAPGRAGLAWTTRILFRAAPPSRGMFVDRERGDQRLVRLSRGFALLAQAAAGDGGLADAGRYRFQAFDADGRERGAPFSLPLALGPGAAVVELAAVEEAPGRLLVVWSEGPADGPTSLRAQVVSGRGEALSPPLTLGDDPATGHLATGSPALAVASPNPGRALVTWGSGAGAEVRPLIVRPAELSLGGGAFRVSVDFGDGAGNSAAAVPLTADTGYFWFFRDGNAELVVKVLDGRPVNGNFWVFAGALSDVAHTVTVEHVASGTTRVYENPPGRLGSFADTAAFPGSVAALRRPAGPAPPYPLAAPELPPPPALGLGTGGRFQLTVEWHDPRSGNGGVGRAVPLTSDTGYFWFFRESNLELMVKVLDGRAVNGRFWVFGAGLSDVGYTLRVTDTATGEERSYDKEPFQLRSFSDTAAF